MGGGGDGKLTKTDSIPVEIKIRGYFDEYPFDGIFIECDESVREQLKTQLLQDVEKAKDFDKMMDRVKELHKITLIADAKGDITWLQADLDPEYAELKEKAKRLDEVIELVSKQKDLTYTQIQFIFALQKIRDGAKE